MSRVGREPIEIPKGTKVTVADGVVTAEGPKGKVSQSLLPEVEVSVEEGVLQVKRNGETSGHRARHGLTRALLANAVHGVSEGFRKDLEIHGVGYRAELKGKTLQLALGYSHPVLFPIPDGIEIQVDEKAGKIAVQGADKQQVGQVAANIRSLRKPEPYKGKGIKYADEIVRRKVGKAGAA
ncbi:MAG: 50S ribosomal protein L6 [Thermoanaerobaculia bacterium]